VLSQESVWEVIVVDDGSVDGTVARVKAFGDRVKILTQVRQGAAAARNLGVGVATGEFIAFLDADDYWMPGKLAKQLSALAVVSSADSNIELVFGQVEEYTDLAPGSEYTKARGVMPGISPITLLARREVFSRVGPFSSKWSRGEFIDWFARSVELGVKAQVLPDVLARRRIHSANSGRCETSQRNDYAGVVGAALRRRRLLASSQSTAAVVLIVFNRPELTSAVFETVRKARPKTLYVISDGPRASVPTDFQKVADTRAVTEAIDWPCEVKRLYAEGNIGIKRSYDEGLSWVFSQSEEAIILEDDCLPSSSFFRYCSELLEHYRDDERVMLISGMCLALNAEGSAVVPAVVPALVPTADSYRFSRYPLTWGWATWGRAWQHYNGEIEVADDATERRWLTELFQDRVAVDYWHFIFSENAKKYTHWDIAWARSCFKRKGLAVHPCLNLISNIGFGSEATHAKDLRSIFSKRATAELAFPLKHPALVVESSEWDSVVDGQLFSGNIAKLFLTLKESIRSAGASG